ncbi:flagellin [Colwelliaceae bacterium 6471]
MDLSINTAQTALSPLERFTKQQEEQNEKLASGLRINSAADDAAGLQLADRLSVEEQQLSRQSSNAQNVIGANEVQSAQLSSISENLERANVLSIQAANPLGGDIAIQAELSQITDEINAIAGNAFGDDNFISALDASDPQTTQAIIENASDTINQLATANGAQTNGLTSQINTYDTTRVNVSRAKSGVQDTDFSKTTADQQQLNTQLQVSIINQKNDDTRKGLLINQLI